MRGIKGIANAALGRCEGMIIEGSGSELMRPSGARKNTPEDEVVVFDVRVSKAASSRCPHCLAKCPGYDQGGGARLWRSLDVGNAKGYIRAQAPRVKCPDHGVLVAHVPWARPKAKHTRAFEDACTWMVANMTTSAVVLLLRATWDTVAMIMTRVVAERVGKVDLLDGVTRIGIDEISYRKGHRYLMVIVDHDTGRLIWAKEGRKKDTLAAFFADLGPQRCAALTHVSCDGAEFIHASIKEHAPNAAICLDAFHVVAWAMKALDKVRTRTAGRGKHVMWAVRKNPVDLTLDQKDSLSSIKKTNQTLFRAYLLKEQLRQVFAVKGTTGRNLFAAWLSWASHCRIPEFVELGRTLRRYKIPILATLDHGLSNGRVEATNTHLRALTKRAYGYHSHQALIAMAMLTRSGICPKSPHTSNLPIAHAA